MRRRIHLARLGVALPEQADVPAQLPDPPAHIVRGAHLDDIAFAFSFLNHLCVVLGVFFLGQALGVPREQVALLDYLVLVPVANIVAAIPLAPGGWGLGELVYQELFHLIGASVSLGVAVSVTFRLCMLLMGLLGSPFLLLPANRDALREAEEHADGPGAAVDERSAV